MRERTRRPARRKCAARHAGAAARSPPCCASWSRAQEDERGRIARDLHDHLGQQLTALRLTLERHREQLSARRRRRRRGSGPGAHRSSSMTRLDFLAWELRPAALDDLGLAAALPRFCAEWSAHYGSPVEFRSRGVHAPAICPRDAEVAFLPRGAGSAQQRRQARACHPRRRAARNPRRGGHAGHRRRRRRVRSGGSWRRQLQGIGLLGMRERAALIGATLEVESAPGEGTSIFLRCAQGGAARGTGDA